MNSLRKVFIIQQGAWDMPKESLPLAAGYLKAVLLADDTIRSEVDVEIHNFRGGAMVEAMAQDLFADGAPDVLAMSVFGWNLPAFGHLAETFKRLNPDGWVVAGGTHVANQAERTFRLFPDVDVIANEEGERTFPALVRAYLAGRAKDDLADVPGISYRADGQVVTTATGGKIEDLDSIPSPFLTGAIPMRDARGEFRYDIALMETNRGCPYRCAFCYWGGAVGQKAREFSRERLREELEFMAFHRVETVMLCDANFGMRPSDAEFVEDIIRLRERTGYPRALETNWTKNKGKVFYEIVERMKAEGLHTSFTLALQTLDETSLSLMNRKNMKLNEWKDLADWLGRLDMGCYVELIWGTPGETVESFFQGYDELAPYVSRIAVYPLLLLPNTPYVAEREKHGFVTVRGERDDFEYVLAHNTMTMHENRMMQRFMFWARTMGENAYFRWIWTPLRLLAGLTQSQVLRSIDEWFFSSPHPAAQRLVAKQWVVANSQVVSAAMRTLYSDPELDEVFRAWWEAAILPLVPDEHVDFLEECFRYDVLTRPLFYDGTPPEDLEPASVDGYDWWARRGVRFAYPVREIVERMRDEPELVPYRAPATVSLLYRPGFRDQMDNQEVAYQFAGVEVPEPVVPEQAVPVAAAG